MHKKHRNIIWERRKTIDPTIPALSFDPRRSSVPSGRIDPLDPRDPYTSSHPGRSALHTDVVPSTSWHTLVNTSEPDGTGKELNEDILMDNHHYPSPRNAQGSSSFLSSSAQPISAPSQSNSKGSSSLSPSVQPMSSPYYGGAAPIH